MKNLLQLATNIYVFQDIINVGIIVNDGAALLIDYGSGLVLDALLGLGISRIGKVLFTHHHRDQAQGIVRDNSCAFLADAAVICPRAERAWFDRTEEYWSDPASRWHLYDIHPHSLMLPVSIAIDGTVAHGDVIEWGEADLEVIDTPGHTDGSISVAAKSRDKCFVFSGDVVYDQGRIWELYSLQKGNETVSDYHGFLGSREQLKTSMVTLSGVGACALIPSHGEIISDPISSLQLATHRIDECYDTYVEISALRHYFPKMFASFAGNPGPLPIRPGFQVPSCLKHVGTSWVIISENQEAFVMDCGNVSVIEELDRWRERGEISSVTGLWITHYHDDHVDAVSEFLEKYPCSVYACDEVAQIIENPLAYRLPCISPVQIHVDNRVDANQPWQWNEFQLQGFHFPGQTFYHGGLFVTYRELRLLFAGDSFTMAGIDDYCSGNRNWLGEGEGFLRCFDIIDDLKPTHIFNCHVDVSFRFTDGEIAVMRENLKRRLELFGNLFPWDHPNYGMDEHWIRCHPYEQQVASGSTVNIAVQITNHSATEQIVECRPVVSDYWGIRPDAVTAAVPAKTVAMIRTSFLLPKTVEQGRYVIPVEISYGGRRLGQAREAIIQVAN